MLSGKLPLDFLSEMLGTIDISDPRVILGPSPGEDAALIEFEGRYLVAKTDPVTFANDLIGWYVVHVNANDLAVMGAKPLWLMVTLLLPEGIEPSTIRTIFEQLREACNAMNVSLVGGHTEITYGLSRPIAIGAMLGEVNRDDVVMTGGATPGDIIILTKSIAIEGTALLARDVPTKLLQAGVQSSTIDRAQGLLFSPGISVVKDAETARHNAPIHSMHDPTEGGLATGLAEVAIRANVGLLIESSAIPVLPECREICDALNLDPLGLVGSGALVATLSPEHSASVIKALAEEGITAHEIGRVTPPKDGLKLRTTHGICDLPHFERDELARYFSESSI